MIGFHIDMNMAQYRADYLKRWLAQLAETGYDTILWEVENNVAWQTCPECASPDAFSKPEFKTILAECRRLQLEPIPLLQTIGHAEYVLKHQPYAHLKELPEKLDQYCPTNPDLIPFLHRWIAEYLEVFGLVRHFHLGADEAWWIGKCPRCADFAKNHSISQLYVDHVNAVAHPLLQRKVTPMIWADMLLHYPQALNRLSAKIMLCDWMYSIYRGCGQVQVWGRGLTSREELEAESSGSFVRNEFMPRFAPYLFPMGDEPGREPETFYTTDYLAIQGFETITCPAASSYGDNVFSPRNWLHVANTFDSLKKGMLPYLRGSLLTSWSVHLFPWELQWPAIGVAAYLRQQPNGTLDNYPAWFEFWRYGVTPESNGPFSARTFWRAAGLLSKSCLFTHTASLGFSKDCRPVANDHVAETLINLYETRQIGEAIENCKLRLAEYEQALHLFEAFSIKARRNQHELALWKLAARNLMSRAQSSLLILQHPEAVIAERAIEDPAEHGTACALLDQQRALRSETEAVYQTMIRPTRCAEMTEYMYGAVERALNTLVGKGK